MEVMRSDGHLLANNVEGVGSIPPPLSQGLCQDSTSRPFKHQMDNELKTHSMDMAPSLLRKDVVPHQNLGGTSLTRIWAKTYKKIMGLN